jgi:hypothetical protein
LRRTGQVVAARLSGTRDGWIEPPSAPVWALPARSARAAVPPVRAPPSREPQRNQIVFPPDHRARGGRPIGEPAIQRNGLDLARLRLRVVDYRRLLRVEHQIGEARPFARRESPPRERVHDDCGLTTRCLARRKPVEQLCEHDDRFCIVLSRPVDPGEQPNLVGMQAFNRRDEPAEIVRDPPCDLGSRSARRPFLRRIGRVGAQRKRCPQQIPPLAIVLGGVTAPVHRRAHAVVHADRLEEDHDPRR